MTHPSPVTAGLSRRGLLWGSATIVAALVAAGCGSSTSSSASTTISKDQLAGPSSSAGSAGSAWSGAVAAGGQPTNGRSLGVPEFRALVQTPGVVLLDVRTPAEFAGGHLRGARNIDAESAAFSKEIEQLDEKTTYAIYCQSGRRSKNAMLKMQQHGFASVADLAGGIGAWQAAGEPVEK